MGSMSAQSEESKVFGEELCFEFAEEAASLWLARQKAVDAPHYTLTGLLEMDNRLEAQIDALRVAGMSGWETALRQMKPDKPETFFATCVLAWEACDENRIGSILEKAAISPKATQSMISALGWITYEQAQTHIQKLLASRKAIHQYIGIAASAFHRRDPGVYLDNGFYADDTRLKARSLQAASEIGGRIDKFTPGHLHDQLQSPDKESRFWAAWSLALLGDAWSTNMYGASLLSPPPGVAQAVGILKSFVEPAFPFREEALNLALRLVDRIAALKWENELARSFATLRLAVIGAGIRGDTTRIPFLIDMMQIPVHARIAGEAFTMITGIDIVEAELDGKWPEGFEAGPSDDPQDTNVALDPDENLPWPDAEKIALWWEKNKNQYPEETRLLLGKPITEDHLQHVLQTGRQRQRAAAALELAILNPGKALYNTAAPAWRQIDQIRQIREENKPRSRQPAANRVTPIVAATPAASVNYGKRELVITAANCITPVGLNALQTAASVRAGICRFRLDENYPDQSGNPITVARIQGIKDNVENVVERIRDIAETCLDHLLDDHFKTIKKNPQKAHFILGAASRERPGPEYGDENMIVLKHVVAERFGDFQKDILNAGNASLHYAIAEAAKVIERDPDTLYIIGCVDCLHRESILDYYEAQSRLKSSAHGRNHGLIASEAVSFLIVEDREHAQKNQRSILARIRFLGLADESGAGKGLTEACQRALEPLKENPVSNILGDLNGEDARAEEWSISKDRCFPKTQEPKLWKPAEYYGDIAAASGGVLACIVTQGFQRNWLDSPAMIFCSDDFGPCGAVVLEKVT